MPEVKQISAALRCGGQKKRVAAYCRVSTNSADQQNSYANQVRTYTRMITQRPDWELVDIFADEGLSGMKASNRKEFQRMIRIPARFCWKAVPDSAEPRKGFSAPFPWLLPAFSQWEP